jgi:hypothetical protein
MEAFLARYEQIQRHVIEARYLGDYKVWLEFNDGRKGVVDLADEVDVLPVLLVGRCLGAHELLLHHVRLLAEAV